KALEIRRVRIRQIVQDLCKEEICLGEAARRVKDLEKENLPPLKWGHIPKEKWPMQLKVCLMEHVADVLSAEPKKADKLLQKLEKEMKDEFGMIIRIERPEQPKENKARKELSPMDPSKS